MHISHSFVFSALPFLTLAIPVDQPPTSRGFAIPVTKHVGDTFNRDPVKLATYEIMKSIATQKAMNIHQNNTGMAHSYADGNEALAKRDAGGVPLTAHEIIESDWFRGEAWSILIHVSKQEFNVILVTGTSNLVLPSSDCSSCGNRNKYDLSESGISENRPFVHDFGGSVMSGSVYSDHVQLAGQLVPWYEFGAATKFSGDLTMERLPADGLLGLGLQPTGNDRDIKSPSVIQSLIDSRDLDEPIYGLTLADKGAEFYIGGIPPNVDVVIVWIRAQHDNKGVWRVPCMKITVGVEDGKEHTVVEDPVEVFLDVGQTTIIGPNQDIKQIFEHIPSVTNHVGGLVYYNIPCDSKYSIFVYMGGLRIEITPAALDLGPVNDAPKNTPCLAGAIPGGSETTEWTFGAPFFKSIYAIFDVGKNKVGLSHIIPAS